MGILFNDSSKTAGTNNLSDNSYEPQPLVVLITQNLIVINLRNPFSCKIYMLSFEKIIHKEINSKCEIIICCKNLCEYAV